MRINKIDDVIEECTNHLNETNANGTEIENYLTRYLLVLISSSFEEEIEKMFIERANKSNDSFLIEYFKNEIPNKLKSIGLTKLSNFIRIFGESYKERFKNEISITAEATQYSNLIINRHLVAHETQNINMTFNEVVKAYEDSNIILDRIKDIIE